MKKLLLVILGSAILFASNMDEINKKLDRLIGMVIQLKKQSDSQEARIEKLEKALKIQQKEIKKQAKNVDEQLAVKSCKKIAVVSFKDKYYGEVIPYYILDYTLKNNYPKKIVYLEGDLYAEDKDGTKVLQDFLERKVDFPVGGIVKIHKKHLVSNDLEKYLKDENVKNLKIYFVVTKATFADGSVLECE